MRIRTNWRLRLKVIALVVVFLLAAANDAQAMFEDDPRWNCRTMGNQVCGVDPTFGTYSITVNGVLYV